MSKLESLQLFFTQRLTAAALEIFAVVEKTVVEYQNEIRRSKEENERLQRTLDLVFKPDVKFGADPLHVPLCVSEEEFTSEQDWNPSLGQDTSQIKEEEQEFGISQEEEQLQALQFDIIEPIFTPPSVSSVCDQKDSLQLSHLYQTGEIRERDSLPTNTTEQFKTEPDGVGYRVSEPTSDSWPLFVHAQKGQSSSVIIEDMKISQLKLPFKSYSWQKPYSMCSKHFIASSHLKIHQRIHTGEKAYQCEQCGKCFSMKGHLTRHTLIHTGEKQHQCTQCGKRFTQKVTLSEHIRTHTGERPFKCSTCGKCFNSGGNLKVHQRMHTGEKPHHCNNCDQCFSQKKSLLKHMINVHRKNT